MLTGILRLSLWQMQLGSLPVFFLVVPMTLAGGFLLKTSEGGLWGPVSSVTLAVAGLSQLVSLLAAMYYISETAEEHYEELAAMPDDEEVAEADRLAAEKVAITLARQSWFSADFPFWMRLLLVSGAFAMSACVYILAIAGDQAFVPFAVNDSVDDKLAGNVANIIKDLGWACIGLLGYTVLVIIIFGRWTAYRIKHLPADFVVPTSIRDEMKVRLVLCVCARARLCSPQRCRSIRSRAATWALPSRKRRRARAALRRRSPRRRKRFCTRARTPTWRRARPRGASAT